MGYWVTYRASVANGERPFRAEHFDTWGEAADRLREQKRYGRDVRLFEANECTATGCEQDPPWGRSYCTDCRP